MNTADSRWERIQTLFDQAADLSLDERRQFLDRECGHDWALRDELESLLESDPGPVASGQSGLRASILTQALSLSVDTVQQTQRQQRVGSIVGAYRLTAVLGHGGAGTVYLGERVDQEYDGHVAVKILSQTLHDDLQYRFHAERQILADLNHPGIATLLDAGQLPDGQPYLVMEYIEGEAIDRYCDSHRLNLKQRLKLFMQVCAAVEHAHQHLIVHRDLKPGNILVTASGEPKLLDFGIAKWLEQPQQSTETHPITQITDRLLTPEYASPEQMLGMPVATTSDVYALGILLYELLIGARPYVITIGTQLELERVITMATLASPSQMLMKRAADSTTATQVDAMLIVRGMTLNRLRQTLRGDLDAMVMRALRREPDERYESAAQFMEDVDRYLHHAPVLARKGNWLYYSRRFLKRHGFMLAVTAALIAGLAAIAGILALQNQQVIAERDLAKTQTQRAETVSNFMLDVFSAPPYSAEGKPLSANELLDEATKKIIGDLYQESEIRTQLMAAIGRAYQRQARPELAVSYLKDALKIIDGQPNPSIELKAKTLGSLGNAQADVGDMKDAENSFDQGLLVLEKYNKNKNSLYLNLLINKANSVLRRGDAKQSEALLLESLSLAKFIFGSKHSEVGLVLLSLAQAKSWQGKTEEATLLTQQAAQIYKMTLPENHPDRIITNVNLAGILSLMGRNDEAFPIANLALKQQIAVYGENNIRVTNTLETLAYISEQMHHWEDAENYLMRSIRITRDTLGDNSIQVALSLSKLCNLQINKKDMRSAKKNMKKVIDIFESSNNMDSAYFAFPEYLSAKIFSIEGLDSKAIKVLVLNIKRWEQTSGAPWQIARSQNLLASLQWKISRNPTDRQLLLDSWKVISAPNSGASIDLIIEVSERTKNILGKLPSYH